MSNKIVQLITLHKNIQGNMQALTAYSVKYVCLSNTTEQYASCSKIFKKSISERLSRTSISANQKASILKLMY